MSYHNVEILFVEDSIDDAALTIRALKKSGFTNKLHHVINGAEALDFLYCKGAYVTRSDREFPKLILLDLKMPKVSGLQVLEKIKSDPILKSIPVVMLTSSNEGPDIERCFELGANSYIVKPVESDNFFNAVKEIGLYWMVLSQPPL
ncbi:two-component system response regulator [Pedobacter cryoconitis]|uniref:Two-component system response regulator n=1 Tax=Pedobacter cryoconitis TaxID=188932 RepID=A0A7W8ZI16_9SPHI|nr:response regulator [Pedobacter cryoconitis]MBB5634429.1 two-component system response regulator [Pedobacter cryoconitis]MBB6272446.1 two-component system response regulator [Pedobacter cryoconitis]